MKAGKTHGGRTPTPDDRAAVRRRPGGAPVMFQCWRDLLFLHWEWEAEEVEKTLPPGLHLDRYEGRCFVGVVPFKMRRVRPRLLPAAPGISDFLELNLRTYVHDDAGLPGVWFYSLDANRRLAVTLARRFFSLPYHFAAMEIDEEESGAIAFSSSRRAVPGSRLRYRWRATGEPRRAAPGSLEYFLLERYVLFASTKSGLRAGRVHHEPYPIRDVESVVWDGGLLALNGFAPPGRDPDHAVASRGVDVSIYPMRPPSGVRA